VAIAPVGQAGPFAWAGGTSSDTQSFVLTNGSTTGRAVVVVASIADASSATVSLTGVTFNGTPMTLGILPAVANSGSRYCQTGIWYILDASLPPSPGSYNVAVSANETINKGSTVQIYELSGADAASFSAGTNSSSNFGTTSNLTPSPASGDFQIGSHTYNNNTTIAPATINSGTADANTDYTNGAITCGVIGLHATAGTISATTSANPNTEQAVVLGINAAATGISQALPTVTETDTAQTLGKTKQYTFPIALETDTAQAIGTSKQQTLPIALETDQAQTLGRAKIYALTPATETDLAVTITLAGGDIIIALQPALETNTALTISRQKEYSITPATETDLAQVLAVSKEYGIVPASETDQAIDLLRSKLYPLPIATELDSAIDIILQGAGTTLTPADIQAIVDALIADGRVMTLQKWLIWREIL
jgi:hypothetical protein